MSKLIPIFIIAFIVSQNACDRSQPVITWKKTLDYRTTEIFPISVGKFGYPYVKVTLNTTEVDLVWDTGNMSGLTLSSELAERMNLPAHGESQSYDSAGNVVGVYRTFRINKVKVWDTIWQDMLAHEFSHKDLHGLVGPQFVLDKRFTIDYKNKVMAVSSSRLSQADSVGTAFTMVRSQKHSGLILVYGFMNDRKVLIEIDTGKSRTVVDEDLARLLKLPKTSNGYYIDEIRLGPHSFEALSAKAKSFKGISQGLPEPIRLGIGSDILSNMIVTVDYPRGVMTLMK
ncbi:MAG: aspartyl protease family protein [bacterium]